MPTGSVINLDDRHMKISCLVLVTLDYEKSSPAEQDIIYTAFPHEHCYLPFLNPELTTSSICCIMFKTPDTGACKQDHGIICALDLKKFKIIILDSFTKAKLIPALELRSV